MSVARPPFRLQAKRLSEEDRRWELRARDLQFQALPNVRAAAEKWGASVAAVFGIFGAVLVVTGRENFSELETAYEVAAGVLVGGAIVAAVWAVWKAALAAQGTPEEMSFVSGPRLRRWELERARDARGQLRSSRIATVVGVVLLLAGIGVTWFGEAEPETSRTGDPALTASRALAPINIVLLRSAGQPTPGMSSP